MVINALAVQANPSSADTLRRFLSTTSTYLGLRAQRRPGGPGGSEFVDPPRYRYAHPAVARRAAT